MIWILRIIGWMVVLLGTLMAMCVIAVIGGTPTFVHAPVALTSIVAGGFVPLLASLVATRNARRASRMCLWVAPFAPLLVLLFSWPFGGILGAVAVFSGAIVIPGLFWFFASRRKWPSPLERPLFPAKPRLAAVLVSGLFCMLVVAAVLSSLALPWWDPIGDCSGRPLLNDDGVPRDTDFTAKILFVGPKSFHRWSLWSVARVEERFGGLSSRLPKLVILRGFYSPSDKSQSFFIEGRRSDEVLIRFLPVIERTPCGRTGRLENSAVELQILRDGPPKDGVRLIGQIYRKSGDLRIPVPGVSVFVTGPSGSFGLVTDAQGFYDITGLPPGQYTINPTGIKWSGFTHDLKKGSVGEESFRMK